MDLNASPTTGHRLVSCISLPHRHAHVKKGSPYSITERSVPELIQVLGSQSADDNNNNNHLTAVCCVLMTLVDYSFAK